MAIVGCGQRRLESEDLFRRSAQAASGLAGLGLGVGSGVALSLRNEIEFLEVSVAAGALGASCIPINWHFAPDEVGYILKDSDAKVFVVHSDLLPRWQHMIPDGVTVLVVPTSPAINTAYGIEGRAAANGETDWSTWLDSFPPRSEEQPAGVPVSMFYTSGTTGRPKGVRRLLSTPTQHEAAYRMLTTDFGLVSHGEPSTIVAGVPGPMYHGAPNMHALTCLRAGTSLVILPRFDPEGLLQIIERERITHLNMVPVMFTRLLNLPDEVRNRYDLSSLRFVAHAAAPCSPDVKRAMIDWWGPVIHEYYGATETGNVTFCNTEQWLAHPGTVGRPIDGAEVRILDDNQEPLGTNEIGEIAVRFSSLGDFTYHNDDAKRQASDRDGFFAPGDVGYLDGDGYLFISDRKVDMIISGGVNIYPAEIEAVLANMPGVADSAVFGIPDDEFGEAVCAIIEPVPGQNLTIDGIRGYLRELVAGYKVPRRIEFADSLPREESGKIFKRKLRAPFWEGAGRAI
jgi:long-chain acyl-CoA synthetase